MPDAPFENLRLVLMNEALPIGMAIWKRIEDQGVVSVVDTFSSSEDPFGELKVEGDLDARSLRTKLDQVRPGLGNPVIKVTVAVEDQNSDNQLCLDDDDALKLILTRIGERLDLLEIYLRESKA